MGVAHDAILLPRHQVIHTRFDREITARTGVILHRFRRPNGLHHVGVAALGFGTPKTSGDPLHVLRLTILALLPFGPVTARHG